MAWQLGKSETTATLINYSGPSSYDGLAPGDGLVYRSGGAGHALLFAGWKDSSKSVACVLHEASTASGMRFDAFTVSSLHSDGYKAIRKPGLTSSSGGTCATGDDGTCAPQGAPTAPSSNGSASATSAPTPSSLTAGTCFRNGAYYCGNPQSNLRGDPNTLYHCEGGHLKNGQACPGGCHVSPQGTDDLCDGASGSSDPNSSTDPFGTGGACIPPGASCTPADVCCDDAFGAPQNCVADPNADPSTLSFLCGDASLL
jgi:hypothetical protein